MNSKIIGLMAILVTGFSFTDGTEAGNGRTASDTIDSFEQLFGVSKGKRRNHTKGFCFVGTLTPYDPAIQQYTNSPLFRGKSKVIGRLSQKGGNNAAADHKPADYGMGLSITTALTAADSVHNMSMNTLDFFPVASPEAFAKLMRAKTLGKDAVKAFKQQNTDLQRFAAHTAKKAKTLTPYEGSRFNSLNSFYLVNEKNTKTAIRWSFIPVKPLAVVLEPKQDFLFDNMQQNLKNHGIVWDMLVTIANDSDPVDNAALAWTGQHKEIIAAKLTVLSISSEQDGACDSINYDPLVLSPGFKPSADPLLQARRQSYAISFGKRMQEKQE